MDYVHLNGSEDVLRASHNMASAAERMYMAATLMDNAIAGIQFQVDRLEALLERAIQELPQGE